MQLTKEFLASQDACTEGYRACLEGDLIGKDYDEAIVYLRVNGNADYAEWLEAQKHTEKYVRANGKVITMGNFQVFNPLIGQHIRCETEDDARLTMIEISKEILNQHKISVIQEISNENGDATWVAVEIQNPVIVS